jgi:hypothetical protein
MSQLPQQTGKRIVSKGEYTEAKSVALLLSLGVLACGMGVGFLVIIIRFTWGFERANDSPADYDYAFNYFWGSIILLLPLIIITYFLGSKGNQSWTAVRQMQPLPHVDAADLSAPESLVRASEEPVREQQAVLLRAATETAERHERQLVRAAEGREE